MFHSGLQTLFRHERQFIFFLQKIKILRKLFSNISANFDRGQESVLHLVPRESIGLRILLPRRGLEDKSLFRLEPPISLRNIPHDDDYGIFFESGDFDFEFGPRPSLLQDGVVFEDQFVPVGLPGAREHVGEGQDAQAHGVEFVPLVNDAVEAVFVGCGMEVDAGEFGFLDDPQ